MAYAQKVTLDFRQEKLEKVLEAISKQTGKSFSYSRPVINPDAKVSISVKNKDLYTALVQIIETDNVEIEITDKKIVLKPRQKRTSPISTGDRKSITGQVSDVSGDAIIGASIGIKSTTIGTVTDTDGKFSLTGDPNAVLIVSYIGYKTQEATARGDQPLNITLIEDEKTLDEVIVVGYGIQKKSDITGSISSVSSAKVNATPSSSLNEMLRGAAAGIQVTTSSAAPGGGSSILVRGRRSLSASNAPLYIVDGVPLGDVNEINSNDIESIEVLKDASAQSIYGARAANGVILITTKRGEKGRIKVNVNSYVAVQNLHRNFDFYNGEEWAAYRKEAFTNANGYYNEEEALKGLMLEVLRSGEFVDWEKLMISSSLQHKQDILIQSGGDKTKYALSLGYFNQDGMVPNSGYDRMTGRLNIDHDLWKNVTIGSNISFARTNRTSADGTFNSFITMPPLAKVYNDDGSLREDVTEAGESHYNPLWNMDNAKNKYQMENMLINMFLDWKITKDISYRANASLNNKVYSENIYQGLEHTTGRNNKGSAYVSRNIYKEYLFENILNFYHDFTPAHHIDATLMQSVNYESAENMNISGTGFANDDLAYNAIGSAEKFGIPGFGLSDRKLLSYLGRVRYNLLERYLFTVSMRIDGSSVFGKNNKYGYFPSAAFAWRINEEPFLKDNQQWLSNLKLRLSYGQVGNQGVSPYTTLGLADKYLNEFGSTMMVGYLPGSSLWNPDLKWETSTSANIGLDFGFFKGRVSGVLEFYDTQTTDLLVARALSATSGYTRQLVNLGQVQNRGVEVSLNVAVIDTKDWSWGMDLSFAKNKNKIKKIDGQLDENGKPKDDINNAWFIGHPMNVYYDYAFDGIWQTDDDIANSHMPNALPGYIKIKNITDEDKENVITTKDRIIYERDPKWIGTIGTLVRYKWFDLAADLYIPYGGYLYNSYLTSFDNGGDLGGKRNGIKRNYWTPENPSNEAPAPNMNQPPAYISILGYQDASYIRLRNVILGYNVPKSFLKKVHIEKLRIYGTLTNFWTKTNVQAYGPEQNTGAYPEPKTALIGLNISF
ncbi:SusC/RagA family TonB-linked outer membrane protein [Bacteroidia bacterium]|nr:SusC/RagA family TonB-linked outer membrane protein [Bacteroidia bacterium]